MDGPEEECVNLLSGLVLRGIELEAPNLEVSELYTARRQVESFVNIFEKLNRD